MISRPPSVCSMRSPRRENRLQDSRIRSAPCGHGSRLRCPRPSIAPTTRGSGFCDASRSGSTLLLESAEIGHKLSKAAYERDEPRLREALLNAQYDLAQSRRGPVLVLISGVDGAGRGETANTLTAWMDPRHIRVVAFGQPTAIDLLHPPA